MAHKNITEHDLNCLTINELEAIARDKMDKQTRDYYNEVRFPCPFCAISFFHLPSNSYL